MIRVGHTTLNDLSDLPDAIAKQLRGGAVWVERDDQSPTQGVVRAFQASPSYQQAFIDALRLLAASEERAVGDGARECLAHVTTSSA